MTEIAAIDAQRQTNRQIGALVLVCGLLAAMFGFFSIFVLSFQLLLMQLVPAPTTPQERQFFEMWWGVHRLMWLFMPTMGLLGAGLAVSGFHVRRGSPVAIRIGRWILLGALGWGAAYGIHALLMFGPVLDQYEVVFAMFPELERWWLPLITVQWLMAAGMIFGPPTLLLLVLSRARPMADSEKRSS